MKRLVIDASTLVSGITGSRLESPPCLIFDAVSEMSVEAIICPRLLAEIERALGKPYFRELACRLCRLAVFGDRAERLAACPTALEHP